MRAVLINKTDELGHHGCTLVNRQIDKLADGAAIDIVCKLPLYSDWDTLAPKEFDAIIVNGEGTPHSSSKGARRIAEVPDWARKRNVPAHLINSVYQDNDAEISAQITKFTSLCLRDEKSHDELIATGISADVIPDLSLTWQTEPASCSGKTIINGSTIKECRRSLYALSDRNHPYLPILAEPICAPKRLFKYRIRRALSEFSPPSLFRARNRNSIPSFDDFITHLRSNVSGIITGRFHMATIALCLEIPVIAISSNTHKMEALFAKLAMSNRVTPSPDRAADLLRPYSSDEIKLIRSFRQNARAQAEALFNRISNYGTPCPAI